MGNLILHDKHGRVAAPHRELKIKALDLLTLIALLAVTAGLWATGHWFLCLFPATFAVMQVYGMRLMSAVWRALRLIRERRLEDAEIEILPVLDSVFKEYGLDVMQVIYTMRGDSKNALACAHALCEIQDATTLQRVNAAVAVAHWGDITEAEVLAILLGEGVPRTKRVAEGLFESQAWAAFRLGNRNLYPAGSLNLAEDTAWHLAVFEAWYEEDRDLAKYRERPWYAETAYPELVQWLDQETEEQ